MKPILNTLCICAIIALIHSASAYGQYVTIPPGQIYPFTATVIECHLECQMYCYYVCEPPPNGTMVPIQAVVHSYTGGHHHYDANRPKGRMTPSCPGLDESWGCPTTINGQATAWFQAPQVSGNHTLTAYFGGMASSYDAHVEVSGLQSMPASSFYSLVGWTNDHPQNHYGTSSTISSLSAIAYEFYGVTGQQMGINDMSLEKGGIFDLGPTYGGVYWNPPHSEHQYGINVDAPFQYIDPYRNDFYYIASQYTSSILTEGNHYHLRF